MLLKDIKNISESTDTAQDLDSQEYIWGIEAIKDDKSKIWTSTDKEKGPWLSKAEAFQHIDDILDEIDTMDTEFKNSIIRVVKVPA